ncbi:MAG: DUF6452 family protein [Flavobacteriaceae bacterium]|nr:DUF6452 family protein [Flavobacteriaceae bacterium]
MKKHITFFIILIVLFTACERDDICIDPITPKLIIRFYDKNDPSEFKKALKLKIQIEGIDGDYQNETTDSIAIPIKTTEDITKYTLTITEILDDETTVEHVDTFDLTYTRIDEFISRSCGYKTLFHNTEIPIASVTNNWINSIEIIDDEQNILNEISAHVKIFH